MKTKKTLLISIFLLMILNHSFSQSYSSENAKEVIKTIWLTYMANGAQGCEYIEPGAYIYDTNTKNIIGQNFLSFRNENYNKFSKIELTVNNNAITGAKLNTYEVNLGWNNNRISNVKIQGVADCHYKVNYNANNEILGFTFNELRNGKQISMIVESKDGQLIKVTQYYDKPSAKNPWTQSVTTYTYNQNEITVKTVSYKSGKSPKPENIGYNATSVYRKINDRTLAKDEAYVKSEMLFDENNIIVGRKKLAYGRLENLTYKYINGELFIEENIITKDNEFLEKIVTVNFSLTNQPESVPNYEKTKGLYKFDKNNDLIFEKFNGKYREKINGVWSDWKNTIY